MPGEQGSRRAARRADRARPRAPMRTRSSELRRATVRRRTRFLLSTFGLISAGKGLETVIEALPAIVERHPEVVYVIAGRTHPDVAHREGERYRLTLEQARARPRPRGPRRVRRPLPRDRRDRRPARRDRRLRHAVPGASRSRRARSPSRSPPAAASSRRRTGTRRTCSPRAPATLVPFDDAAALADAVCRYIERAGAARRRARRGTADRRAARLAVGRRGDRSRPARGRRARAAHAGRPVAGSTRSSSSHAHRPPAHARRRRRHRPARERRHPEPRRAATASTTSPASPSSSLELARRGDEQIWTSILYRVARLPPRAPTGEGGMRNFMGYDRRWLDEPHVGDHVGRSVWALGEILATAWIPAVVGPTRATCSTGSSARSRATSRCAPAAYAVLGLARLDPDRLDPAARAAARAPRRAARRRLRGATRPTTGSWFEDKLTYDNARLPHALIVGGDALGRDDLVELGLESLRWLGDESGLDDGDAAPHRPPRPRSGRAGAGRRRRAAARRGRVRRGRARRVRGHRRCRARRPGARAPSSGSSAATACSGRSTTSRPAAAATGSAARRLNDERRRRVDARVPPRRAAARRRRRPRRRRPDSRAGGGVSDRELFDAPPGQPDPDGGRLAVSGQRRLQPGRRAARRRDRAARARRGPAAASRTSPSRARRTASTAGSIDPEPLLAPDDGVESEQWGFEDPRVVWVAGARALGDHLHRVRPGRPGRLPRDDRGLQDGRAPRDRPAARGQERGAAAAPDRRPLGALPPPEDRVRRRARRDPALPLDRPRSSWSAPEQVLQPRDGAWWDSLPHRHRPAAAPNRARLAAHLPRRQGDGRAATSTASASRCSTSTSRPACCTGCPSWILGADRAVRARPATSRTSSSRAGSSTTRRPTSSGSTTAPRTPSICLATARLGDLLDAVLPRLAASRQTPERSRVLRRRALLGAALLERLLRRFLAHLLRLLRPFIV